MNEILNRNSIVFDSLCSEYDVSVCIITYNKERYIKEAIESVLMQETTCRYEIVVGDNSSTDQTPTILKSYWEKDKEHFSLILNNENLGLTTNIYNTMMKAKGKYIIILYGDDYWISPEKMQRQFDYLEKHMDVVGVTATLEYRYDGENTPFKLFPNASMRGKKCTLDCYLSGYDFPMAGVMFRNDAFNEKREVFSKMLEASLYIDDLSFCILLLSVGDVFILAEPTSAYRCFKKTENAGNFNSVNSTYRKLNMSMELLSKLWHVTDKEYDFRMRFGLVLVSALKSVLKKEISRNDYTKLVSKMPAVYQKDSTLILLKALAKKLFIVANQ